MITTRRPMFFAAAAVIVILAFAYTLEWAKAYYLSRAQDAGRTTLTLVAEAVDQAVGRFSPVPGLIASDPAIREMLIQESPEGFAPFMSEKLRQIALSIGTSEVYMLDHTGLTVASSNYRDEDSFIGKNFSYRPYFINSIDGRAAMFHALGTTSGERGFFFSAPILDGIDVLGVLVVKITVGGLESDWLETGHEILIGDSNGIVFMSSREDYKFRALAPLTDAVRRQIRETQQYPIDRVIPIDLSADVIGPNAVQVTLNEQTSAERYLASSLPLSLAGWHAIALTPMQPVQSQVFRTMALCILVITAVCLAVLVILQRRSNILQRIEFEKTQRVLLEEKVRERTADLDTANAGLLEEVAERRLAEERLRKSQKELVQAGKLAALGQMSAAISHEINQPLAAIKSYAVNATEYLSRSRYEDAKTNIASISTMSDRMAAISQHLRNFARQPGDKLKAINVSEAISETIGLVGPQTRAYAASIDFTEPTSAIMALGGKLRLQQVLVNIITNALEAMNGQEKPQVEIGVEQIDDTVAISLRDHGPGVPEETLGQVFDAFYTTKNAGAGMGLGMSISQNIINDFGGALHVSNHPEGGAVFKVTLQAADA